MYIDKLCDSNHVEHVCKYIYKTTWDIYLRHECSLVMHLIK